MPKILVLNGPNLNLLGAREPEHYGNVSLDDIKGRLSKLADSDKVDLQCRQSNAEDDLINWIQQAADENIDFIIINPAAFTHTSVAVRDAFGAVKIPFVEIHLSNVHAREPFRRHSYFSDMAEGVITGLGAMGYEFAYHFAVSQLDR